MATLVPTLQTWAGMVCNGGKARDRATNPLEQQLNSAKMTALFTKPFKVHASDKESLPDAINSFAEFIRQNQLPVIDRTIACAGIDSNLYNRIMYNVYACSRRDVTPQTLKNYIRSRKRIDVEQAAALVLCTLPRHLAAELVPHLRKVIYSSNMWLEKNDECDGFTEFERRILRDIKKVLAFLNLSKTANSPKIPALTTFSTYDTLSSILPVLHRIRHKKHTNRCLFIPQMLYELFKAQPPVPFNDSTRTFDSLYVADPPPDVIYLSPNHFRKILRLMRRLLGPQDQVSKFRKQIHRLRDDVEFGLGNLDTVVDSIDDLSVAYTFFNFQRHLQLKVVSNLSWTAFLEKGQSSIHSQNTPWVLSTFEVALARMATDDKLGTGHDKVDYATLTAITTPPGLEALTTVSTDSSGSSKVLRLIDECCLLMEKYVSMNGNGRWSNLRFKKHMSGGSGRGPVDDYNLLCDILSNLRRRYYESKILEGDDPIVANDSDAAEALKHRYENELPGAVYKFLAKDIMTFNHSWQDDAFGDPERVPGWYQYLKSRRESGFIPKAAVEVGP